MTGDPLDLTQVAADEVALDQLRTRSVNPDDSALQLLRDLLVDVDQDLPREAPVGCGSTVLRLAVDASPEPRVARGGTVVALMAAGVVAFGGVAAASTSVAPGNPLHGLGESVRAAAGAVVDAVKPPEPVRRADPASATLPSAAAPRASEAIASRPPMPVTAGPGVAEQARSDAAARQVGALLDEAQVLLDQGRTAAAGQRLDLAERRLADVLGSAGDALRERLRDLRAQLTAAEGARPAAPAAPKAGPKPAPAAERDAAAKAGAKPDAAPGSRPAPKQEPRTGPQAEHGSGSAARPVDEPQDAAAVEQPAAADEAQAPDRGRSLSPRQPSRLASTKPRA